MKSILHLKQGEPSVSDQLGPYELRTLISEEEEISMTAYRVVVKAHARTAIGYHEKSEELYYVIAGQGLAVLNGEEYALAPGDFLRLPPGTRHGFVTGSETLEMLDIHHPGSRPDRDIFFVDQAPEGFPVNEER